MDRAETGRVIRGLARSAVTVLIATTLSAAMMVLSAPESATTGTPGDTSRGLYPVEVGDDPVVVYTSHQALVADYQRTKADLEALRRAVDYAASYEIISPSVHEWADGVPPGTFGGGSKP